jgi:hypothetical protein
VIRDGVTDLAAALSLGLPACAGNVAAPVRSPDLIEAEELAGRAILAGSVFDVIERLRPTWLRPRPPVSMVSTGTRFPAVLMNNSIVRDLEILRSIRAADVISVRYVNPSDATTRFGTGVVNGVIQVTMRGTVRH